MARNAGRNGAVYMALTSGGSAEPVTFQATWSIAFATDKFDVTSLGDSNKVYVAGLPDASGDFSGFWDDATVQTFTAAQDGVARKFYLYPKAPASTGPYWFGTVLVDHSVDGGVGGAINVKASWNAASTVARVG